MKRSSGEMGGARLAFMVVGALEQQLSGWKAVDTEAAATVARGPSKAPLSMRNAPRAMPGRGHRIWGCPARPEQSTQPMCYMDLRHQAGDGRGGILPARLQALPAVTLAA
ncbi:hypothetical protein MVI01_09310 [Myxococcus virescens]|uniref:Uncharacterized protein n=1 Tax=Myxococcus virescens TaxID=83456 RepID=A0A511H6K6_9BACT|nr:hypothetical protein MVI01_09310 [Myxococcus virescens]